MRASLISAIVLGFFLTASAGYAGDTPIEPNTATKPIAGKKLTATEFFDMVEKLDYDVVEYPKAGDPSAIMKIKVTAKYEMRLNLGLDADGAGYFCYNHIIDLSDADVANPAILLRLLELNNESGRVQFRIGAKEKVLYAAMYLPAGQLTSKKLRADLEKFVRVIGETDTTWNPKVRPPAVEALPKN